MVAAFRFRWMEINDGAVLKYDVLWARLPTLHTNQGDPFGWPLALIRPIKGLPLCIHLDVPRRGADWKPGVKVFRNGGANGIGFVRSFVFWLILL